jgi:hypothetical protein
MASRSVARAAPRKPESGSGGDVGPHQESIGAEASRLRGRSVRFDILSPASLC